VEPPPALLTDHVVAPLDVAVAHCAPGSDDHGVC
jgi:hypothetical protein